MNVLRPRHNSFYINSGLAKNLNALSFKQEIYRIEHLTSKKIILTERHNI